MAMKISEDEARELWKDDDAILCRIGSGDKLMVKAVSRPEGTTLLPVGMALKDDTHSESWNRVFAESHAITVDLTRTEPEKQSILNEKWYTAGDGETKSVRVYDPDNATGMEEVCAFSGRLSPDRREALGNAIEALPGAYRALQSIKYHRFITVGGGEIDLRMTIEQHDAMWAALKKAGIE